MGDWHRTIMGRNRTRFTHTGGAASAVLEGLESRSLLSTAWGVSMGGAANDDVGGIAADSHGNIIVTGSTRDASWIPTPGSLAEGTSNAYVAKFTDAGQLVWATTFGWAGYNSGNEVAVDADGSIFIVGSTNTGPWDSSAAFVAKFSDAGELAWANSLGTDGTRVGYDIALDASGSVVICGIAPSGSAGMDAFAAKLGADGELLWRTTFGAGNNETAHALAIDAQGGIWVVGESRTPPKPFQGGISFGAVVAESSATMIAQGAFLAHLSADGVYRFGGDVDGTAALDVAVVASGDVYVAGVGQGFSLASSDASVTKCRPDGTTIWSRTIGQTTGASAIVIDANGAIYIAGYTVEENAPPTADWPRPQEKDSGFISGLTADGTVVWTRNLGDRDTVVRALALGPGRIFAGGHTGRWSSSPWTTHDAFVLGALTSPADAGQPAGILLMPFPGAPGGTIALTTEEGPDIDPPGDQPPTSEPPVSEPPVLELPENPEPPQVKDHTLVPNSSRIRSGQKVRFHVFRNGTPLGAEDGPIKLFLDTNRNGVIDRKDKLVKNAASVSALVISSRQLPLGKNQILAKVAGQTLKAAVTVTEANRPTATLDSVTTRRRGQLFFVLANVRYQDDSGIQSQSLTTGDIYMRNPVGAGNGFWEPKTIKRQKDGSVLVQYVTRYVISKQFPLPRGTYVIMLAKDQVSDTAGNWAAAKRLGTFNLAKPITSNT